jgi:hypothetical protein
MLLQGDQFLQPVVILRFNICTEFSLQVDARPVGQACSHDGGAAAERLPFLGSAAA